MKKKVKTYGVDVVRNGSVNELRHVANSSPTKLGIPKRRESRKDRRATERKLNK
jgi:hypothetical protein